VLQPRAAPSGTSGATPNRMQQIVCRTVPPLGLVCVLLAASVLEGCADANGASNGHSSPTLHACSDPVVDLDGEWLAVIGESATGGWLNISGRDVFRIRLTTNHDPAPEAVDDEFSLVITLDVAPMVSAEVTQLDFHQQVEVDDSRRTYEDWIMNPAVASGGDTQQEFAVQRVFAERVAYLQPTGSVSYEVDGELASRRMNQRLTGMLTLDLQGRIAGDQGPSSWRTTHCFDVGL
jgi:hypothetical protein